MTDNVGEVLIVTRYVWALSKKVTALDRLRVRTNYEHYLVKVKLKSTLVVGLLRLLHGGEVYIRAAILYITAPPAAVCRGVVVVSM